MTERPQPMPVPSPETLAAAEWLSRREGGEDLAASGAFAAWLAADPSHRAAWTQAEAVWRLAGVEADAGHDPLLAAMRRDALAARPPPAPQRWRLGAAVGAGLAAALVLGVVVVQWRGALVQRPSTIQVASSAAGHTYDNGAGLPRTVALEDGSSVTLDAASTISVEGRQVRLMRGQAYFQVVHDPARPFQVAAQGVVLTDIGTNFNVRVAGVRTVTTVICGSVSASAPGHPQTKPIVLIANQTLEASPQGDFKVRPTDLQAEMAWREAMLEFHDTPLSQAVAEINRYGGPPVRVVGTANLRVSGAFRAGDPARFAHAVAEIYPVTVRPRPDGGADIIPR